MGGKLEEATNGAAKNERTSMMRWKTRLSWDATLQSAEIRCSASPKPEKPITKCTTTSRLVCSKKVLTDAPPLPVDPY
jgi:hypothetical protein